MTIKIFKKDVLNSEIISFFNDIKEPFIIRNVFRSKVNINFLKNKFYDEEVLTLNENSDKELLKVSSLLSKIKKGKKYRLRANTKIGNKIFEYIDSSIINRIKGKERNLFDYLLS